MNSRRFALQVLASVAAIAAAFNYDATGQEPTSPRVARPEVPREPSKLSVIPLRNAKATSAVEVLSNLFAGTGRGFGGGQPETIIAEPRTNSLVVRASDEVLQQLTQIIEVLDVPQPPQEVKVFQLHHTPAAEAHNALMPVAAADVKIAIDAVGNRVIAQGNADSLEIVEALLMRLDEPPPERAEAPPPRADDVQVRLVWLVAGLKDSPAAPPPADLENVVKELESMGVSGLKTAAQVFVKTVPAAPFNVTGSAVLDNPCSVEVSGTYARRRTQSTRANRDGPAPKDAVDDSAVLEISVRARPYQGQPLADLQTTITAPEGHSVVLGVSPVGELTSVFVVQLRR